jgi:hypothetical protein
MTTALFGTSEATQPEVELRITFFSKPKVRAIPPRLEYPEAKFGAVLQTDLQVSFVLDPQQITAPEPKVVSSPKGITCTHLKTSVRRFFSNGEYRVATQGFRVTIHTTELLSITGPRTASDFLEIAHTPEGQPLTIPVEVALEHHPSLDGPSSLLLGRAKQPIRLVIHSRAGLDFEVTKTVSDLPGLSVENATLGPASRHELLLCLDRDTNDLGAESRIATVHVFSSLDPEVPYTLEVAINP